MTFPKSCSAWWPMSNTEFSKPFVKPASALNRAGLFPGLLYHKNDHLFFSVGLEYFELLWLSVVPQFLEVNKDLEGRWAHDGLRVMWLTGGRPGFWSPVFGLPGQCSVLRLPLLPQPPLRLRVKRCFSDNSSVLLCHLLPTEFFFFFFPVGVKNISKLQTLNMIEG